ncbi:MAG TPA: hypothetical protein VJA40_05825 [archaeon]|nr:hypothetical protein [archaeon]
MPKKIHRKGQPRPLPPHPSKTGMGDVLKRFAELDIHAVKHGPLPPQQAREKDSLMTKLKALPPHELSKLERGIVDPHLKRIIDLHLRR